MPREGTCQPPRWWQAEKARLTIDSEKQDPFQFASVWLWRSRCVIIPYIFNKHEHDLLF